jgi:hypothetical protein
MTMNKADIVARLDGLKKAGVPIRPYKKSEKKAPLEALLAQASVDAKSLAPTTTLNGSDAEGASEGESASPERIEADSATVDPASVPVHSDSCTPALDPDGWGGQNQDSQACIDCLKEFPECYEACAAVTALVAAGKPKRDRKSTAGSQAALIDDLLVEGKYSVKEMEELVGTTVSRIRSHIYHLTKVKGCKVKNVDGKYVMPAFAKEEPAEAATEEKAA